MRVSSILRLASAAALLCSMSSFSGCQKDNVSPNGGCVKKTTTTTTTSTGTGTSTGTTTGTSGAN